MNSIIFFIQNFKESYTRVIKHKGLEKKHGETCFSYFLFFNHNLNGITKESVTGAGVLVNFLFFFILRYNFCKEPENVSMNLNEFL